MSGEPTDSADVPDRLPFNRKERYYTGTVFPMLVASHKFEHLGRFIELCGLPSVWTPDSHGLAQLQFFTEYGFAESVFTPEDRRLWPDAAEADTPDVVIAGHDWLIAVEAKMYHKPTAADLAKQMSRQSKVIATWVGRLGMDPSRMAHVLLLPERLSAHAAPAGHTVVTWEAVLNEYKDIAPEYWVDVLENALTLYPKLVSRGPEFGKYAHDKLTGDEIVQAYKENQLLYDHVGRGKGGVVGSLFRDDIDSGGWRTVRYEVRTGALPDNPNWFSIGEFLAATGNADLLPESSQELSHDEDVAEPGAWKLDMRHAIFMGGDHAKRAGEFARWCEVYGAAWQLVLDYLTPSSDGTYAGEHCTRVFYVMPPAHEGMPAIGEAIRAYGGEPIPIDEYPGFIRGT